MLSPLSALGRRSRVHRQTSHTDHVAPLHSMPRSSEPIGAWSLGEKKKDNDRDEASCSGGTQNKTANPKTKDAATKREMRRYCGSRCSSTHTKTMTIYTMMSAAKAVKARTGGAIVNYNEEQQGAPPAAAAKPKATPAKAKAAKAPAPVVTGGKARETGFVLARAKLGAATSELAATRDRQGALLGKGVYRDAERRLAARRRRARCRRRRSRSEGTPSRTRCTRRHSSRGWRGKKMWSTWKVTRPRRGHVDSRAWQQ